MEYFLAPIFCQHIVISLYKQKKTRAFIETNILPRIVHGIFWYIFEIERLTNDNEIALCLVVIFLNYQTH